MKCILQKNTRKYQTTKFKTLHLKFIRHGVHPTQGCSTCHITGRLQLMDLKYIYLHIDADMNSSDQCAQHIAVPTFSNRVSYLFLTFFFV